MSTGTPLNQAARSEQTRHDAIRWAMEMAKITNSPPNDIKELTKQTLDEAKEIEQYLSPSAPTGASGENVVKLSDQ